MLHRRAFRDTSLILEMLTSEHGRIAAVARAARAPRSSFFGLTEPFRPVQASWTRRGEMATLVGLEPAGVAAGLTGRALWCGLYANELLMRLTARDDPEPEIYHCYAQLLPQLNEAGQQARALRSFEMSLLRALGVAPDLALCSANGEPVKAGISYRIDPVAGPIPMGAAGAAKITETDHGRQAGVDGRVLLALVDGEALGSSDARAARAVMRQLITHQLDGRPLMTPALFREH